MRRFSPNEAMRRIASFVTALLNLHYYAFDRRVSRLTAGANLVRIKPKQANKQSAQDCDCDHMFAPTELKMVNASETKGASSRRSFCNAKPDTVSTPRLPACKHFGTLTAASCSHRRLRNGAVIGLQFVIFHNLCISAPLDECNGRSLGTTTCGAPSDRAVCSSN